VDLRRTKLSVVQQESRLGGGFLLKGHNGGLCLLSIGGNGQVADLSTWGSSAGGIREEADVLTRS
jgi:hypothetical protein